MKIMDDFVFTNRWKMFKKKMKSPEEKELVSYIELLELQIQTLEILINKCIINMDNKEDDGR